MEVAPPWYNKMADLVEGSDIDSSIKMEAAEFIRNYYVKGETTTSTEEKKKYYSLIKEILDKKLIKEYKSSLKFLGKVRRGEELSNEEKEKYSNFIDLVFLWKTASNWYYKKYK